RGRGVEPRAAGARLAGLSPAAAPAARGRSTAPRRGLVHRRGGRDAEFELGERQAPSVARGAPLARGSGRSIVNRCLRDKALAAIFAGEDRVGWRRHLHGCPSCAGRYRALERDMRIAVDALVAGPPEGLRLPARTAVWRFAPAVAAFGLALALVLQLLPE